jgi:hypothetical protein
MVLSAKVLTVNAPAGTGNQAYTGVGFQPQALVFFYTTRTSDGTSPGAVIGVGMATSSAQRYAWGLRSADNVGTSEVQSAVSNAMCVRLVTNDTVTTGLQADLVSLDADGFTLNWTQTISGADVHVLALAGLSGARVHGFTVPTSTGNAAHAGAGFAPDGGLFLVANQTGPNAGGQDAIVGASFGDGTSSFSLATSLDDFSGIANGWTVHESGRVLHLVSGVGVTDGRATLASLDADGFTLNCDNAYGAAYVAAALLVAGLSVKAGSLTAPASTGAQAYTGVGFQPRAIFVMGSHQALSGSPFDGYHAMFGAASGPTARAVVSAAHVDASDPLQCDHDSDTGHVVKALTAGTPTVDLAADLDSFDADGFTLDWTTVGTGAGVSQFSYLAMGDAPGGGGGGARSFAVVVA